MCTAAWSRKFSSNGIRRGDKRGSRALRRLEALTGLRYLAALSVLLAHMGHNMPAKWDTWFSPLSSLGMPLFFTLSGFLMAYNYSAGFQSRFGRTLRSYLVARFARIYPVYALCLLLSFSFMGGFFNDLKERPGDVRTSLLYLFSMTQSWAQVPVFQDYGAARTKAGRGGQRTCGRNDSAASRVIRMANGAIRRAAYPSPATGA